MRQQHRMIITMGDNGQVRWLCPICGREMVVSADGMRVLNPGYFWASHYGQGAILPGVEHVEATQSRAEFTVTPVKKHPWDKPVAASPAQTQGPWWEVPGGGECTT